ncbi:MAG: hypothetical protein J6B71_02065 [Clostridia bacterium]|nr:hypothetical protein [Clostridia bacterium]
MTLKGNGLFAIFDPKNKKIFTILSIVCAAITLIVFLATNLNPLSLLILPAGIVCLLFVICSSESVEYELRDDRIIYKQTFHFNKGASKSNYRPSSTLEAYVIVSMLHGFRFEQTAYEKKLDVGRIYFYGRSELEAERPLMRHEKELLRLPTSYVICGVKSFERIKETLHTLLPPEKFTVPPVPPKAKKP